MCDPSETDEIEEDKSVKQERYEVTGMTCSACSSRVEKCVSKIDGVENVSVNLLTNSMQVSYDENKVNEDIIVSEVEKAGYGAALENARRQSLAVANDLVRAYGMLDVKLNKSLIDNIMILGLRHAVEPLDPENQPVRWELP